MLHNIKASTKGKEEKHDQNKQIKVWSMVLVSSEQFDLWQFMQ